MRRPRRLAVPQPDLGDSVIGLIGRAFDPAVLTPDDRASERILDAAVEIAGAVGMRRITIDEVASRAGVGRMTLYRRFGERSELVAALVVRETRRVLVELERAFDPSAPLAEQVADGFVAALGLTRSHPILRRLADHEPGRLLSALNDPDDPVFEVVVGFAAEHVRRAQISGEAHSAADPAVIGELLFRIGLSFLLLGRGALADGDEASRRSFAREAIMPILQGP